MVHDAALALGTSSRPLFLSYASDDQSAALDVADALAVAGMPVWIDRRSLRGGDVWAAEITHAIASCAVFVVLCTPASVASRNVRQELQLAWDHDRPILPVILEPVEFTEAMAYFLQGRQWIDVRGRPTDEWLIELKAAVARFGIAQAKRVAAAPATGHIELPTPPGPLIGRESDVASIVDRFHGGSRLITLTGSGGVGKTRLALAAVRRAAESLGIDAHFIDLAPIDDPDQVLPTIARSLGVRDASDRTLREALRIATRGRRLVLLLDNFEQVIDSAPSIGELLADAPELRILVTSREALRLRGEQELVIEPLDLPSEKDVIDVDRLATSPSVALFVDTARGARAGFGLSPENAGTIAEICRRLDGLPLAIELAATRVKHLSPAHLLDQLERRLPVLTGGPRDLPARQRTLRDTIAWSYALLSADEQALFRRLSVFTGGAPVTAIGPVVSAAGPLAIGLDTGLSSLVDKSLLNERTPNGGQPRYSMLETIREFALDQLIHAGESAAVCDGHAAWVLEFLEPWSGDDPYFFLQAAELRALDDEVENIRAAFDHFRTKGEAESGARLLFGYFTYLYTRARFREARSLGQSVLELAERVPIADRLRGRLLAQLAVFATMLGDVAEAESLAREGLALQQRSPANTDMLPDALTSLVIAVREQGRFAEAMEFAERAYEIANGLGQRAWASFALFHVGKLAYLQNDLDRAHLCLSDALNQTRGALPNQTALYAAVYLATVQARRGAVRDAAETFREYDLMQTTAGSGFEAHFLDIVAVLAAATRPIDAVRIFGTKAEYAEVTGFRLDDEPWIAELKVALREQLGESAYQAAFAAGRKLGPDDILALRREILSEFESAGRG